MEKLLSLPTFFAAAKKVGAAPHRGNTNRPTRKRDPAKAKTKAKTKTLKTSTVHRKTLRQLSDLLSNAFKIPRIFRALQHISNQVTHNLRFLRTKAARGHRR